VSVSVLLLLAVCIVAVAVLYSCIGHGGASGYIAVLALFSLPSPDFKPTALVLNILVSAIATFHFARSGHFSWSLFWPFAVTSIPFSYIGGGMTLPENVLKSLMGILLLASACRLFFRREREEQDPAPHSIPAAMAAGAGFGLLSGLTGVGGGIFLSPLLLLLRWAKAKEVAAVSALFILVNSAAGLLGHIGSLQAIPGYLPVLAACALCGGMAGSVLGSRRLSAAGILKVMSVVLTIAGFKLLLV
jgi:uncharacterized membrane protein YfcA